MKTLQKVLWTSAALVGLALVFAPAPAAAQICHFNNVTIDGSLCVGFDCICGESFGFDTIRLKENNLRIHFDDTSTSASFPRNDWRIRINDSANGGASYYGIEDATAGRTPFRIVAGARQHALYVDAQGDVGIGTSTPVVELHVVSGDTPTLRLEQDGSAGFTPQTWDVAGNETNFFIRDATSGSQLPFRIRPSAPSNSIFVDTDGDVGLGTASPSSPLHIRRTNDTAGLLIEDTEGTVGERTDMLELSSNGGQGFTLSDTSGTNQQWTFAQLTTGSFSINALHNAGNEFILRSGGRLDISGSIFTGGGTCGGGCDQVFEPGYDLPSIEEHAKLMWTNGHLPNVGPTPENAPINLSDKTGRMLNELEKAHIYIEQLDNAFNEQSALLEELKALVCQDRPEESVCE